MIEAARPIRLKSGAEAPLSCRVFELPEAELIRQAVTEAAIIQAVGRARGVNRSAANPVEVYIVLHDTTVPIAVDSVVEFGDLEPTKIDIMMERGLVPQWGADAAKLYPDLWPTAQAAQKAYGRAGLDVERFQVRSRTSSYKYTFIRPCTTPHLCSATTLMGAGRRRAWRWSIRRGLRGRASRSRRRWGRWHRSKCSRARTAAVTDTPHSVDDQVVYRGQLYKLARTEPPIAPAAACHSSFGGRRRCGEVLAEKRILRLSAAQAHGTDRPQHRPGQASGHQKRQ
jgi:hypothetical protein